MDDNERFRTFLCVDLPLEVKEKIISLRGQFASKGLRFVSEDNMHITLMFLGDMGKGELEKVKGAMDKLEHDSFVFSVKGISAFSPDRPRVIFAKIEEGVPGLKDIYGQLAARIAGSGIKTDSREYAPHITMARVVAACNRKELIGAISKHSATDFGSGTCNEVKLKRSILAKSGPIHSDLYIRRL
jgi:2'-5' RNA ligase